MWCDEDDQLNQIHPDADSNHVQRWPPSWWWNLSLSFLRANFLSKMDLIEYLMFILSPSRLHCVPTSSCMHHSDIIGVHEYLPPCINRPIQPEQNMCSSIFVFLPFHSSLPPRHVYPHLISSLSLIHYIRRRWRCSKSFSSSPRLPPAGHL